jgi:hypothetical protein
MRILRGASEAEVIASFLRGELASPRWGANLLALLRNDGMNAAVVVTPDVESAAESAYREQLLERHRAWLSREGLFSGFPLRVDWSLAALARDELLRIRYINWDWWLTVSDGTRDPVVAARRIHAGEVPGVVAQTEEEIAADLRSPTPPPPLIVVAQPHGDRLVVLEGHGRLTAYALFPEYLPDELDVYIGTADDMAEWTQF